MIKLLGSARYKMRAPDIVYLILGNCRRKREKLIFLHWPLFLWNLSKDDILNDSIDIYTKNFIVIEAKESEK